MEKILWLSRHAPSPSQVAALGGMYGADTRVVHRDIGNATDAAGEFTAGGYRDLVAVVPLATLDHLCREGLRPLWAEAVEESDPRRIEFRGAQGQGFRFDRFRRVVGVSLDLAPVDPRRDVRRVLRITQHSASAAELAELRRLFGARVAVNTNTRPVRDGRGVTDLARAAGSDEVVLVAPYSVYDQLTKAGKRPLRAELVDGRFVAFHRILGVRIDLEELA